MSETAAQRVAVFIDRYINNEKERKLREYLGKEVKAGIHIVTASGNGLMGIRIGSYVRDIGGTVQEISVADSSIRARSLARKLVNDWDILRPMLQAFLIRDVTILVGHEVNAPVYKAVFVPEGNDLKGRMRLVASISGKLKIRNEVI